MLNRRTLGDLVHILWRRCIVVDLWQYGHMSLDEMHVWFYVAQLAKMNLLFWQEPQWTMLNS